VLKKYLSAERTWPTGIAIFMTAFIAVNLAFVTMAFRHRPQLVSDHYYADGYNLRDIAQRKAAGEATGWNVQARVLPLAQAEMPLVEVNVSGATGAPCDSLTGEARFYRPSDKSLDIAPLPLHYVGHGRYLAFLPRPLEHGSWQAIVYVTRGKQELEKRVNLFVEQ
jgi:nitrogen fixation protein FixH